MSETAKRYNLRSALLGSGDDVRKRGTQEGSVRQKDGKWYGSYYRYVANLTGDLEYKRKEVALGATSKRAAMEKVERMN